MSYRFLIEFLHHILSPPPVLHPVPFFIHSIGSSRRTFNNSLSSIVLNSKIPMACLP
ncbi:Uncharacterized protein F383_16887 [Gossypium arboreum]|uniref:Uncharacterized protein n=1 Tax=Gossypium arboreum TaxID=29729 RepID=A0A0B0NJ52_GOSAR|nr:Uncharacterized protein F383_16887 [Gossypium arboreum]